MTIDARAYTWCNLGPLSDEGASIAEDHAQGAGVLMVKGTVNLSGIYRPTSGAVVKLAYSDGQTWIAQFPLRLRVLSCFSDPIRNKTTVSVGCDLAYYENRKEPVTLDTRDENTGVSEAQWRAQTPAMSASWLVGMILCILRIQYTGNIPLTNYYTRQDFDMSGGYVEELGKLCASEGYVCRMNEAGLAEFISKDQPITSSTLLTENEFIDFNPVNSGELPGDAVYAKYNSISLKAPDSGETDEDRRKRDWELDESFGPKEPYKHTWTKYEYTPTGATRQSKDSYGYNRFDSSENEITAPVYDAKGYEQEEVITAANSSKTETTYDKKDRVVLRTTETTGIWGTTTSKTYFYYKDSNDGGLGGGNSADPTNWNAISCSYGTGGDPSESIASRSRLASSAGDNNDNVEREVTYEWSPLGPIRQQLGVQAPFNIVKNGGYSSGGNFPSVAAGTIYQSLVREVRYERDQASGISKTITTTRIPYIQTYDGSESLSREREKVQPWENQDTWVGLATSLRDGGTEVKIRTEREFGTQRRPSAAERTTESNQKAPNVEQESRLAWAVGSAASQTAVELSPPYAPDDRVVGSGSNFIVIPSDAAQKVLQYARLENRYLFGHRNGVGIQVLPEALPPKPLSVVYIRLKGCTGAFLVNGRTWNLDPSGATVTCDALFWGAIDGTVGNAWFPLPPNISALPTPVAITSNSNPVPANAIPIPTGFNFNNPDLNALFGALPANTAPIPPATIAPAIIIKPYRETIFCGAGSGSGAIADPQFWIAQPPGEYTAGSGSGVLATAVAGPSTSLGARWTSGTTFTAAAGTAGPGHGGGERWASGSVFVAGVGSDGLVRAPGARWTSATVFTAGAAEDGLELAPGASWTSGSTFTAGAGSDDLEQAPGATWASASTFLAGAGDDGIELAPGASWSSGSTFTAGAGGVGDVTGNGTAWTSGSTFTAGAGSVVGPTDPNFSTVSILLHMDGANGSTTFTDSSSNALSVTAYGNAAISTAQAKFDQAAYFDGTGDYLSIPRSSLFLFAGDFTVELWYYETSRSDYSTVLDIGSFGNVGIMFRTGSANPGLFVNFSRINPIGTPIGSVNTWNHVAMVRSGTTITGYVNGTSVGTLTDSSTVGASAGESIHVGNSVDAFGRYFTGYVDELRISKFARYLSSFTPPTAPFPNS